jgi:beta-lactamase regulating signal transducer with metallopeptidase domain
MTGWIDRLGAALLDASLAATAITGLVILAMLHCRQPAHRIGWARTGLLATLALLPLAALNPVPRIDLRGPIRSLISNSPDDLADWLSAINPESTDRPVTRSLDDPEEKCSAPTGLRKYARIVVAVYLSGLAIGISWLALGIFGATILVRRGSIPSDSTLQLYQSLLFSRNQARPRLLVSERVSRPVVVGSFRPVILIPVDLDAPVASSRLRLSLLHELAHVEKLDHRFGSISLLALAVWFFLPTFWWIRDQLKLDQEFLADRRAVSHFGTSGCYASSLVELAGSPMIDRKETSNPEADRPPVTIPRVASALVQRVQMLLRCPFPIEGTTPRWWRWSTALTLGMATLAASCLTLRGFRGWSEPALSTTEEVSSPFQLKNLVIAPRAYPEPFEFPYQLPDQFTLTLEVMAEPADLARLEILGHRLGLPDEPEQNRQVYRLWHRVQIRRLQGFEFVEVDAQSLTTASHPTPLATRLTILPLPDQPTHFRDLKIE